MKVLWFTHSMAGFSVEAGGYNGCGWITSLLEEFKKQKNIQIGIAFLYQSKANPVVKEGVEFFPIEQTKASIIGKIKTYFGNYSAWHKKDYEQLKEFHSIIDDFNPDIIHVWGTETGMGQIAKYTKVPVIVHLQGLLNPYRNALLPPGISLFKYIIKDGVKLRAILKNINDIIYWKYKSEREISVFKSCNNYFGRTNWDYSISFLFSPQRKYYLCNELLRKEFYNDKWTKPQVRLARIVTTISSPLYKGADLVLKTAKLLKEHGNVDFEWILIGVSTIKMQERLLGIKSNEVSVRCIGVKTAAEIREIEMSSLIYFHPSYIDNSPNSVCEAQLLGLPVIAVNVGGVGSLIANEETGLLIPPNEPHMAAATIIRLLDDENLQKRISINSRQMAYHRHNSTDILKSIIRAYTDLNIKS